MGTASRLLKESWVLVEDHAAELAQHLYARVFLADPDIRELFPVSMQTQNTHLIEAIVRAVQTIEDPYAFDDFLRTLGRDHRKFHVTPEHYAIMGAALLDSLRTFAGAQWTIEYDQAWRDAYDAMATKMLTGAAADPGPAFWSAEVVRHERRGRDVAVLTCRPLLPYPFRPGQYAGVACPQHPRVWRSYSIANAPRPDGTLDFHVRAVPGGWVSGALVRHVRVGDMLHLGPPQGTMTLDPASTRDILCIAGGTGLAPVKAIVEELSPGGDERWVHLFLGARDRDAFYDLPALRTLASRLPWLSVTLACSDDASYDGERGTVAEVVARHGPWLEHDVYACGSAPMMRATFAAVANLGVAPARVHYDPIRR
ncbi:MAG: globin domain-containing protein [Micromonosporaceae bacterium]